MVRSEFPNVDPHGNERSQTTMQFDGRFKLVDNGPEIPPELYDLQTDPREITNLQASAEHRGQIQKALGELRAWVKTDTAQSRPKRKNREEE